MHHTQTARNSFKPNNIPAQLMEIHGWLNWRYEQDVTNPEKWKKVPYYASGSRRVGTQGTPEDLCKLSSFDKARRVFESSQSYAGLGLAMLPQWELVALDIDDCVQDGQIADDILRLIDGAYAEISPSGTGIRAFWKGTANKTVNGNWELYPNGQYVTVTGNQIPTNFSGSLPLFEGETAEEIVRRCTPTQKQAKDRAKSAENWAANPFFRNVNTAALDNIRDWAVELFPDGRWSGSSYRVSSKDYGRPDLQEDLSINPLGIQNFGEERGITAIDLVIEHHDEINTAVESAFWLCSQMGINPAELGWVDHSPQAMGASHELPHNPTQDNVGILFRNYFRDKLLYAHDAGSWYQWTGSHWKAERTGLAFNFAREVARKCNREGARAIGSANFCAGVEKFAQTDRAFAVTIDQFDTDNYLLNTPAGIVDLRTNTLRRCEPVDMVTYCTNVAPCAEGGDVFLKFLDEITCGDQELADFLQVALGCCLSGAIENHWLMFWIGTGRNGKNTLGDLVAYILGDYARKVPRETLVASKFQTHPTDIANLRGIRLATSSEVEDGDHWNESRLNEVTGDETLSGRFMRGDFFTFRRTHKHLIYGNHRPQLKSIGDGIASRIKIVPFKASFIGREDHELPAKLRNEAGFVLNWLLGGHQRWLELGRKLPPCAAVEAESQDYIQAQSTVEMWLRERCKPIDLGTSASGWTQASQLYVDYRSWKNSRGEIAVSQQRWAEVVRRQHQPRQSNGMRYPLVFTSFN